MIPALGTWGFARKDWGNLDDTVSREAISAAYAAGIRKFDTAYAYGRGHSENLLAGTLGPRIKDCFVATKLGPKGNETNFTRGIEASLKRLRREYIDLFYIHWPSSRISLGPSLDALVKARDRGTVRAVGICNAPPKLIDSIHRQIHLDAVQDGYSLLWRKPEEGVIEYCRSSGIAFEAYSPLAQGLIVRAKAGAGPYGFTPEGLPAGDKRRDLVFFRPELIGPAGKTAEMLQEIARKHRVTVTALAYAWISSRRTVNSIIIGPRTPEQVESSLSALWEPVPEAAVAEADAVSFKLMLAAETLFPECTNFFGYEP